MIGREFIDGIGWIFIFLATTISLNFVECVVNLFILNSKVDYVVPLRVLFFVLPPASYYLHSPWLSPGVVEHLNLLNPPHNEGKQEDLSVDH
jgi:hypothetical protein